MAAPKHPIRAAAAYLVVGGTTLYWGCVGLTGSTPSLVEWGLWVIGVSCCTGGFALLLLSLRAVVKP